MVRRKKTPIGKSTNNGPCNQSRPKQDESNNSPVKKIRKKQDMQVLVQHNPRAMAMYRNTYKEIEKLQRSAMNVIPFQQVIREILQKYCSRGRGDYRIQIEALKALQESAEMYLVQYFKDAYFCCLHAKRKTLNVSDMYCARRLRGPNDVINH